MGQKLLYIVFILPRTHAGKNWGISDNGFLVVAVQKYVYHLGCVHTFRTSVTFYASQC